MHIPLPPCPLQTSLALVESRLDDTQTPRVGTCSAPHRETLPLNAAEHRNPLPEDFWRPALRLNTVRQEDSVGDEVFLFFPFSSLAPRSFVSPSLSRFSFASLSLLPFFVYFLFPFFFLLLFLFLIFTPATEESFWKTMSPEAMKWRGL